MKKLLLVSAMAAVFFTTAPAFAQTTMPLNTGYDHGAFAPYPNPTSPSTTQDNYWIKIASYEPPAPSSPVAPAWVIQKAGGWSLQFPNTQWIGPRNTNAAPAGSSQNNPAYSIFRKCFCLMKGYKEARLNFQLRADDNVQVWLNSVTNTLVPAQIGNHSGTPLTAQTMNGFKQGKNCVYVLVEDTLNGSMGFNLSGSVSAIGLMPQAAASVNQTFAPCACDQQPGAAGAGMKTADEEQATVNQIIKIAEDRRKAAMARPAAIERPVPTEDVRKDN